MSWICLHCGYENDEDEQFCLRCGSFVGDARDFIENPEDEDYW